MKQNFFLIMTVILTSSNLFSQELTEELFIPWGESADEVNYREEPAARFGPQSFSVSENALILLDPVNNSIKFFKNKKLIKKTYAPSTAKDFAIINDHETHFIVGNEIHEYTDRELTQTYHNPEKFTTFEEIRKIKDETIIRTSDNLWTRVKKSFLSLFKDNTLLPDRGQVSLTSKTSAEITLFTKGLQKIIPVNHNLSNLASMQYLGYDKLNRIYVDVNLITQQVPLQVDREVWLLNQSGEKLGVIEIPAHYFTTIHRDLIATPEGQLYHMLSSNDGIHVFCWDIPDSLKDFQGQYPAKFKKKIIFHTDMESDRALSDYTHFETTETITRDETIAFADTYVQHVWTCKAENLTSGVVTDPDGDKVETADWIKIGQNQKIPYKWGGFDLLEVFDSGLAEGDYAGDTYTDGDVGSAYARGVDCSGFVSRCWQLPSQISTRMMDDPAYGAIAQPYTSWDQLKPGDAIHRHGHVILFVKHNANGTLQCVEAAASTTDWKVDYSTHSPYALSNYSPVFYKNMEDAPIPAPQHVTLTSTGTEDITISFDPVEMAEDYVVFYGTDSENLNNSVISPTNSVTISDLEPATPYFFQVKARNNDSESLQSGKLFAAATSEKSHKILIVNGFDRSTNSRHDYIKKYATPVTAAGYGFSYVFNESLESGRLSLSNFHTVLWMLGDESTVDETFSATEQSLVKSYLKQGGNLFVTGSEIGWDLEKKGSSTDINFYHNFLKAQYIEDTPNNEQGEYYTAEPVENSILTDLGKINFDNGTHGTINVDWPDVIKAINGAENCLIFSNVSNAKYNISHSLR